MTVNKIIFLSYLPLTAAIEKAFYLEHFAANGLAVEYWDLTAIYFKKQSFEVERLNPSVKKYSNYRALKRAIAGLDREQTIFIPMIEYDARAFRLYLILSRCGVRTAFFATGKLPLCPLNKKWGSSIGGKISYGFKNRNKIIEYVENLIARRLKRYNYIKEYSTVFAVGEAAAVVYVGRTQVVPINYSDYDDCLENLGKDDKIIEGKYAVFLDSYLPFHPDFKIFNIKQVNADRYYDGLNRFFSAIEGRYGIKVVIAAHPKADYGDRDYFGGRRVVYGKTNQLVKRAEFALAHLTTSISYPVIYKKPIVFLVNDEMRAEPAGGMYRNTLYVADLLGCGLNNIDQPAAAPDGYRFDQNKYEAYKYGYLTSKSSENELSKHIVYRALRDL